VHNGIPVAQFPMVSAKSDDVLYLGALSPNKGVHLAIDAAARLSPHACREHAVHHFDTGRMLDDYDALYRRVALEGL
jgi:hypothetical protein